MFHPDIDYCKYDAKVKNAPFSGFDAEWGI
jgi:hypothetical protein